MRGVGVVEEVLLVVLLIVGLKVVLLEVLTVVVSLLDGLEVTLGLDVTLFACW